MFTGEGPPYYAQAYQHNAPFAVPGPYQTQLSPAEEAQFRAWVQHNGVPFNPNTPVNDYDMRGYWKATGGKGWKRGDHFPDTYKTPYDTSFSNESKYATTNNPFEWEGDNLVDTRDGSIVFGPPQAGPPAGVAKGTPSGYGRDWHLEAVRPDGSRRVVQAKLLSTGGGETHWEADLMPGETLKHVTHGGVQRA